MVRCFLGHQLTERVFFNPTTCKVNQLLEERLRAHVRSRGYEGEPLRQELMAPDNSVALVVDTEGVATALSLLNSGLFQVWCLVQPTLGTVSECESVKDTQLLLTSVLALRLRAIFV